MTADRKDQLPWEDEPYQDRKTATDQALQQAVWSAPGQITVAQARYARRAFELEIDELAGLSADCHHRNHSLNTAAFNLAQFVAAGALDEREVRQALYDACQANGHLPDDGANMVLGTIESGFEGGMRQPRDLSHVTGETVTYTEGDEPKTKPKLTIPDIESGFWTKRDSLQSIYLGALSRMCSPWAVLAHCAARALALVRPSAVLPPLIGGPGSLNWFAAIAAPSGGGKGSSASVAKELVKDMVITKNLGSGEGLIDAFVKPADKENNEPQGLHEAVMFMADEIDTMQALGMRTGSTLSGILRSAFTAETIGFSYRTASSRHLQAHTYRMTLVANVQPAKAGALMDDQYGGTLQRFMWFPGSDARIDVVTPLMPGALDLPPHTAWQYPRELKVPYIAKHLIKQERAKAMRGEQNHLDGHALFIREKFAFALAVLDGRDEMTEEDWRLASVASRVSDHTREWVTNLLRRSVEEQATERGRLQGVSQSAADEEKTHQSSKRMRRIGEWALKRITEAADGLTQRELTQAVASRDRPYLATALEALRNADLVRQNDDKRWVKVGG